MKTDIRDFQRSKVYRWENDQPWFSQKSYLSEDQVLDSVKKLDRNLPWVILTKSGYRYINDQKRKTKIIFSNGRGSSNASDERILLKRNWALNYSILLHEYSHLLSEDVHGPNFVSIYCCLLVAYHPDKPTFKELAKSLNEYNIDFKEFDYTWKLLKLSNNIKPFNLINEENKIISKPEVKRLSPKMKSEKIMEEFPMISVDKDECFWVHCNFINNDPYDDEHYCDTWKEALERVEHYRDLISKQFGPFLSNEEYRNIRRRLLREKRSSC